MALKSTVFKAELQISDMQRQYYKDHTITIARHPSETDERMMMRVFGFALHSSDDLIFGKGISTDDEPDLWQKDLTGAIMLWIDVGLPDEKRIRKACGRAKQVIVYCYGGRAANMWWEQNSDKLNRLNNLIVINVPLASSQGLAAFAERSMKLQFTIQDEQIWASNDKDTITIERVTLLNGN